MCELSSYCGGRYEVAGRSTVGMNAGECMLGNETNAVNFANVLY